MAYITVMQNAASTTATREFEVFGNHGDRAGYDPCQGPSYTADAWTDNGRRWAVCSACNRVVEVFSPVIA